MKCPTMVSVPKSSVFALKAIALAQNPSSLHHEGFIESGDQVAGLELDDKYDGWSLQQRFPPSLLLPSQH